MADNKLITVLILAAVIVGAIFFLGSNNTSSGELQSTTGVLIRTVPVSSSGSFTVTYSSNKTGQYGIIIEDEVSSNCKFSNGKTTYKSVMLGDGPTSQSTTVSGQGECVLSGNYNIIDDSGVGQIKTLSNQIVQ